MRPLTASDILQVWERGNRLHPVDRALALLATANPDTAWEELAHLPVGQRDDQLLSLRELTFGPRLTCYAECPQCGERLEFEVEASQMHLATKPAPVDVQHAFQSHGYTVHFRLPNSFDLAAAARSPDAHAARKALLEGCVLAVESETQSRRPRASQTHLRPGGLSVWRPTARSTDRQTDGSAAGGQHMGEASGREGQAVKEQLPESLEAPLMEHIAQADPQADVQLDLSCPACGQAWALTFDIESFLWTEVNSRARRLLRDVHTLAQAYGWREADILSMSAHRRQAYVDMVLAENPERSGWR